MPARRFFVEGVCSDEEVVPVAGKDARKIVRVLRLKSGDTVEIVDSAATVFQGSLEIDGNDVRVRLRDGRAGEPSSHLQIDVAQAIPKGQKMDFIVEKLSELGVSAILPFESERCIAKGNESKVERWRRIAEAAAQQSGRASVARVEATVAFAQLLEIFDSYDTVLFPWEIADRIPLRETLPKLIQNARRVLIVIGPEGGFSHQEAESAQQHGAAILSLGEQILRTETAALFVVSVLNYLSA